MRGQVWDSGAWWMLLAAQSMAVGTVLVPWVSRKADNVMATGYHMLLGGLPLAALALPREADGLAERLPLLTGAHTHLLELARLSLVWQHSLAEQPLRLNAQVGLNIRRPQRWA